MLHGYRSGLEEQVAKQLKDAGIDAKYETEQVGYLKPARQSKYTPDFILPNGIVIETKGRFVVQDRQKHIIIKNQYPNIDIRFVFSNSKSRISKNSKTTYAMWATKHGFKFADKFIPEEWLKEKPQQSRFDALQEASPDNKKNNAP